MRVNNGHGQHDRVEGGGRRRPWVVWPGLDVDKGPAYFVGAMIIGFWTAWLIAIPVAMMALQDTQPLAWLAFLWSRWAWMSFVLAIALIWNVCWNRMRGQIRPRRFGISRLEAQSGLAAGPAKLVVWSPYDDLPQLLKHWVPSTLFTIGDRVIEYVLAAMGARRAPMVEEPPEYHAAPKDPPDPPAHPPQGGAPQSQPPTPPQPRGPQPVGGLGWRRRT